MRKPGKLWGENVLAQLTFSLTNLDFHVNIDVNSFLLSATMSATLTANMPATMLAMISATMLATAMSSRHFVTLTLTLTEWNSESMTAGPTYLRTDGRSAVPG